MATGTAPAALDCTALYGSHSDDVVTVHAGSAPLTVCGRHAVGLDARAHEDMRAARTAPREAPFRVHCGYCGGEHLASLDTAPYGGTMAQGYGPCYGVDCTATGTRYGVLAATNSRIA